jgi:hypothetical protein
MKKKETKKARARAACAAESCRAKTVEGDDLCTKHRKQENASPCTLTWDAGGKTTGCPRPQYAQGLCEPHYRRRLRNSRKWDKPLIPPRERIYVATRVLPETHNALVSSLGKSESLYSKLGEIIEEWVGKNTSLRKTG